MANYQVAHCGNDFFIRRETNSNPHGLYEYFAGYDWMGSAMWEKLFSFDYRMTKEEALMTVKDLRAAD